MIDAHHHIWRQADLPWLLGPEQPRIFGPYAPIKRDYLIGEYLDDLARTGVQKSVYVQANWAPNWAADEAAWVQKTANEKGWPHAIVAYADMTVADVRPALDKLAAYPLVKGIRQQFHHHENPLYCFAARSDLAEDATVQRNIAHLADYGWAFDLQVFAPQMAGATQLAAACPDVTFVLQHAGMLEDLSDEGRTTWRTGMQALAAQPNVTTKLSGLGTFIHANDPAHIADIVRETVKLFGPDRCLFGSNFPIEKIWTSYDDLLKAYRKATAKLPDTARQAIFNDTAARVYWLEGT
ncbi:MAG: amidohydrolase family protein [Pseudomonadota bacterium]